MAGLRKLCSFFSIYIIIAFMIAGIYPNQISGQVQPIKDVEEKLQQISNEEKAVLGELFILSQEIDEMEREEAGIAKEIESLQAEIDDMSGKIAESQKKYDDQLSVLGKLLASYQRHGPASFLNALLSADNLTDLIRRINIIRDLTRNTDELLASLEAGKKRLSEEKAKMEEDELLLEAKKRDLQDAIGLKQKLKKKQEDYLESLADKAEQYKDQLGNLQEMWSQSKVLFSDVLEEFATLIENGEFSIDDMDLSFDFPNIKGALREDILNDVLRSKSDIPEMQFHFYPEAAEIEVSKMHLKLRGAFAVESESTLKFEVQEGSFYEMPLERASIEELLKGGYLLIDFKKMLGSEISFVSVESREGYLEFRIKPDFLQLLSGS